MTTSVTTVWLTWREATRRALYSPGGFYRRERPGAHFRTSVHASPLFARAVATLAGAAGARGVVDVGAGGGELLAALHVLAPELELGGVDVGPRPPGLPAAVAWTARLPSGPGSTRRLLIANEWLDNVPVDVAEVDAGGRARLVLVDPAHGSERLGDPVTGEDAAWLARWWPLDGAPPGSRAEIGHPRDEAWAGAVGSLAAGGVAVAVDYAHTAARRPPGGSLAGYRAGRAVQPVPDGSCDVTAHVALDACAAAGSAAGARATLLTTQRDALAALGVAATRPLHEQARLDPAGYLAALAAAGEAAELREESGLGGFAWLVQGIGRALPAVLGSLAPADRRARASPAPIRASQIAHPGGESCGSGH